MLRYSASVELNDTAFCFLFFQDTIASPRNKQKPVSERLVKGQLPQSAFENPFESRANQAG